MTHPNNKLHNTTQVQVQKVMHTDPEHLPACDPWERCLSRPLQPRLPRHTSHPERRMRQLQQQMGGTIERCPPVGTGERQCEEDRERTVGDLMEYNNR